MRSAIRRFAATLIAFALMITSGMFLPVMADDGTGGQVAPKKEVLTEAQAIEKYGTYHGKNATRIPVITYHQVVSNQEKKTKQCRRNSLCVSSGNFEKQMRWLKKNRYRTINCEEFYLWHEGKIRLPKKSVLITFDDGLNGVADYAYPILRKYGFKATSFIIGAKVQNNEPGYMSYQTVRQIQQEYPDLEFQSHTYNLHWKYPLQGIYPMIAADAQTQKAVYDFDYLAYPYGRNNQEMINAYRDAGIKMAFAYGSYGQGYATRKQNIYKIKRLKVSGNASMGQFRRLVR